MSTKVDEMLEFAIEREKDAAAFYDGLATMTTSVPMKAEFARLANQERGHQARLENAMKSEVGLSARGQVLDLRVATYIVGTEPHPGMPYEELLVLAIHREAQAVKLYTDMANEVTGGPLKSLLLALAREEAEHKHKFEVEFDDEYLAQN